MNNEEGVNDCFKKLKQTEEKLQDDALNDAKEELKSALLRAVIMIIGPNNKRPEAIAFLNNFSREKKINQNCFNEAMSMSNDTMLNRLKMANASYVGTAIFRCLSKANLVNGADFNFFINLCTYLANKKYGY